VAAATARKVSNGSNPASDWEQGYGYQFWRCRHGVYRGDGAFGQVCVVLPESDVVVAITSGTRDLQGVLNLVWQHLLPAMQAAPLGADAAAHGGLSKRMSALTLPTPPGQQTSPNARRVSARVYEFPKNDDGVEALGVDLGREPALVLTVRGAEHHVPFGLGAWRRGGRMPMGRTRSMPDGGYAVAASAAWTDPETLAVKACFYETPFCLTLGLRFAGDALVLDRDVNVGFGPTKRPTLVGVWRKPAATARPKG
jgi:hypothetical protein